MRAPGAATPVSMAATAPSTINTSVIRSKSCAGSTTRPFFRTSGACDTEKMYRVAPAWSRRRFTARRATRCSAYAHHRRAERAHQLGARRVDRSSVFGLDRHFDFVVGGVELGIAAHLNARVRRHHGVE